MKIYYKLLVSTACYALIALAVGSPAFISSRADAEVATSEPTLTSSFAPQEDEQCPQGWIIFKQDVCFEPTPSSVPQDDEWCPEGKVAFRRGVCATPSELDSTSSAPQWQGDTGCPEGWTVLHRSVCYERGTLTGPVITHVVRVGIRDPEIQLNIESGSPAPVSRRAGDAVAAANASFFNPGGDPVGPLIKGEEWVYNDSELAQVIALNEDNSSDVMLSRNLNSLEGIRLGLSGSHKLIDEGRLVHDFGPDNSSRLLFGRHPRTAVGVDDNKFLYIFVVDGRCSCSIGMTMPGLRDFIASFDVDNAINLDGGRSSTLVTEGEVVNRPSGGYEAPVAVALTVAAE